MGSITWTVVFSWIRESPSIASWGLDDSSEHG